MERFSKTQAPTPRFVAVGMAPKPVDTTRFRAIGLVERPDQTVASRENSADFTEADERLVVELLVLARRCLDELASLGLKEN